ncbi:MAG: hypothetical protein QMD50_01985 [Patescibacteria group bacterium]|nr:hypothetical protein [Patescibacteria group bacterium]
MRFKLNLLFVALVVFGAVFFGIVSNVQADVTGNLFPIADGVEDALTWRNESNTACYVTTCYTSVDETPASDTDYIKTIDWDLLPSQTFDINESSIPNNATITQMDIYFRAKHINVNLVARLGSLRCFDGSCTSYGFKSLTTSFANYSISHTGLSYTKTAGSDIEIGVNVVGLSDGDEIDMSQIYVVITYTPSTGITVSGTIYSDEGTTAYNCSTNNLTVQLKVDGAGSYSTTCTASGGTYSISSVTAALGAVITVFLDNETPDATTVTRSAGANITGLNLYQSRVIVSHEDAGPITNTNLDSYDSGNDADIMFTVTSGALTVSASNKLVVLSGKTFTPGGNVSTPALEIVGTFNQGVYTLTLSAGGTNTTCTNAAGTVIPLCVSGTFNANTGTTLFMSTAAATLAATTYYNLQASSTGVTFTLGGATTVSNDLTITAGTLAGTSNLTVSGGDIAGNGTINLTNGTTTLSGTGSFGGNTAWTFFELTFGVGSAQTTTATGSGGVTVSSALLISTSTTLNASPKTWSVSSTFTVRSGATSNFATSSLSVVGATSIVGTFSQTTGTTTVSQTISGGGSITFGNLVIATSTSVTLSSSSTVQGVLTTRSSSIFSIGSGVYLTLSGTGTPLVIGGTFNPSAVSSAVLFTGSGSVNVAASSNDYYNLVLGGSATTATYTAANNINITNEFKIATSSGANTFNASTRTILVGNFLVGSNGLFTASSSTFIYRDSATTTVQGLTYYNLTLGTGTLHGPWVLGGNTTVGNVLTFADPGTTKSLNLGAYNLTLSGTGTPLALNSATITTTTGAVNYTGSGSVTVASTTYKNIGVGTTADSNAATYTLNGNTVVTGQLTVGNVSSGVTDTFSASSYALEFSGGGTGSSAPLNVTSKGSFTSLATVGYTAAANTDVGPGTYGALNLSPGNANVTYAFGTASGQTIAVSGDLKAYKTVGNYTVTLSGTYNPTVSAGTLYLGYCTETCSILNPAFTFNAGGGTYKLTGTGSPFIINTNTLFVSQTSTFSYIGTGAGVNIISETYYNLSIGSSTATTTYTAAAGNITVGGNLLVATSTGTNTFDGGSATITLTGGGHPFTIASNEVFTPNASTINYTATSSVTLGTNYTNLGVGTTADSGTGVTYTLGANTTVSGVLTIGNNASTNSDTLNGGSYILTLSASDKPLMVTNKGVFNGGTGTVVYTGNGTTNITATSTTYYNLRVIPGSSGVTTHYFGTGSGQTITVNGNLDLARDYAGTINLSQNNPNIIVSGNLTIGYCSASCGANQVTVTKGSGTITFSPTGTKTWTDNNTTKQNIGTVSISGGASTPTINLGSAVLADSISVASGHVLNTTASNYAVTAGSATITGTLTANGSTITLSNTGTAFSVSGMFNSNSSTVLYAGSGSNTTVGAATYYNLTVGSSTGTTSYIAGGNITVGNRLLVATSTGVNTFNGGTATINISGSGNPFLFGTNATFAAATSTVVYSGASATTIAAKTYYNLQTNNSATYTLGGAIVVNNDLTLTDGILAGTANVDVSGGDVTGNGVINLTNGLFYLGGSGYFGGASDWNFYELSFKDDSNITSIGTGNIVIANYLYSGPGSTFNAGQKTWTLSGSTYSYPFECEACTFNSATSTFVYSGNYSSGNSAIPGMSYYNVTINNGSETFDILNGFATNNNLTITAGTFSAPSGGTITISGSYSNSGTFTHNNGTVVFNATSTGKTIVPGGSAFYNLTFNGSGGGWSSSAAMVVGNDLTMTAGTLSGTQSVTVNGGDVSGNGTINLTGGTFTLNGSGSFGGTASWTFSSLTFGSGGTASTTANGAGGVTVSSVLTIGSGSTLNGGAKTWTLSGTGTPFVATGAFTAGTSKIVYAGTTTATNVAGTTYYNIDIGSSTATTTFTLAGDTTVSNVMTIITSTGTNTLNGSTRTLIFSGTGIPFIINERPIASAFSASNSTVRYTGGGSTTNAAATYYNLEIKSTSGTHTLESPGTFAINNNLVIGNGTNSATIDASGPDLTVTGATTIASNATFIAPGTSGSFSTSGNYSNSGTFTAGSGTVTLVGSSLQTLSGSMTGASAFNILTITNNSGSDPQTDPSIILSNPITATTSTITTALVKVRFPASQTSTLTNINWQGGPTTSTPVYLRSSSAGNQWGLAVTGSQTVQYVDAKDSNACSGNNINANNATTIDSGNNSCWTFPAATYATSGVLYSHIIDTQIQGGVAPNSFLWRGTKPTNTNVEFQFAFSNTTSTWNYLGSDCTSDTYYSGDADTWISIAAKCHQNQRYLRYKVFLETTDTAVSPTVTEVILNYAQ